MVRSAQPSPLHALPVAVALGLALFVASLTWQVPTASAASGPLDAQASELVRLFNGARATNGLAALGVDPFLAAKARDGAIPCPDDASKTIAGRAQDFAAEGAMSHYLRLCDASSYTPSSTLFVSTVQSWGYGSVGEIMLDNGGYGSGAYLYSYNGWQTWTYSTTGHGMLGWQSSSSHWNIIMGGYDRVGCGGWASGSTYWYDCVFAAGGPNGVDSPPTSSPFDLPLPTAAPTPAPTPRPTPVPHPPAGNGGSGSGSGSGAGSGAKASVAAATSGPIATQMWGIAGVESTRTAQPTATPAGAAAAARTSGSGSSPTDGATGLAAAIARVIALVAGSAAVLLYGCSVFAFLRRRRRGIAS